MESGGDSKRSGRRRRDEAFDQTYLLNSRAGALSLTNRIPFPVKLCQMLEDLERSMDGVPIVSWSCGGRAFKVHDKEAFVTRIMPQYFRQTRYKSFQRQLHLYGFARILDGKDKGSYSHTMFQRAQKHLCHDMLPLKRGGSRDTLLQVGGEVSSKRSKQDLVQGDLSSALGNNLSASSLTSMDDQNGFPSKKMASNLTSSSPDQPERGDPGLDLSTLSQGQGLMTSYGRRLLLEDSSNPSGIVQPVYFTQSLGGEISQQSLQTQPAPSTAGSNRTMHGVAQAHPPSSSIGPGRSTVSWAQIPPAPVSLSSATQSSSSSFLPNAQFLPRTKEGETGRVHQDFNQAGASVLAPDGLYTQYPLSSSLFQQVTTQQRANSVAQVSAPQAVQTSGGPTHDCQGMVLQNHDNIAMLRRIVTAQQQQLSALIATAMPAEGPPAFIDPSIRIPGQVAQTHDHPTNLQGQHLRNFQERHHAPPLPFVEDCLQRQDTPSSRDAEQQQQSRPARRSQNYFDPKLLEPTPLEGRD